MIIDEKNKYHPNNKERSWREINMNHIASNYHYLRSLAPQSKFLGIVKANAYGHGGFEIGHYLQSVGADMLAVACIAEGIELRTKGIKIPILILGNTPPQENHLLFPYHLTQTVHDFHQVSHLQQAAKSKNQSLQIHLKIDTGMGRLGFQPSDFQKISSLFQYKEFQITGIFTHFAQSENNHSPYYTKLQYKEFIDFTQKLKEHGITLPTLHCANSGATLFHREMHLDMIRPGIALYGYSPDGKINQHLKPILSLFSRIASLRALEKGTPISYGSSHILEKDSLIAVIPLGYGDGYPRSLSNKGKVEVLGKICPILGKICMDMMMIDVTALKNQVQVGDIVTIYGNNNLLEQTAELAQTISYELLCQLSPRVPKLYIS